MNHGACTHTHTGTYAHTHERTIYMHTHLYTRAELGKQNIKPRGNALKLIGKYEYYN